MPNCTTINPAFIFFLAMGILISVSPVRAAGTPYTNSAHGSSTTGVSRVGMGTGGVENGYAIGNCAHCHEQHSSIGGTATTPFDYLGLGLATTSSEEDFCYTCHKSGGSQDGTESAPADDIKTDITKSHGHGYISTVRSGGGHYSTETQADIAAKKHVECTDCHDPHKAGHSNHEQGTNAVSGHPLDGALGATYNSNTGNWNIAITYNALAQATSEYQVCFKCHSEANTDWPNWGGTNSLSWTDVGLEFNPNNKSFHPVVAALNSSGSGSSSLANNSQRTGDDFTWSAGDTMYCSDCHKSDSTAEGPHGSAAKWMLGGTNKAWPYTTKVKNGTNSSTAADFRELRTITTNQGNDDGLFCLNCHPVSVLEFVDFVHWKHVKGENPPKRNAKCVDCHIRVPHGGKVSRLINAGGSTTSWNNLPARYQPAGYNVTGNNGTGGSWYTRGFRKVSPMSDYNKTDCYGSGTSSTGISCSAHNSNSATYETW